MRGGLLLLLSLLLAPRAHAQAILITDFDGDSPLAGWRFENGPEFPGAKGSLTVGEGRTGAAAVLGWDFSGGGNYVQAIAEISPPRTARGVEVWIRSDSGAGTSLRIVDTDGQTFQHRIPRRPDALDRAQWFRAVVDASASLQTWGGPADGTYSGTLKAVSLTAGAPEDRAPELTGAVAWDDLASYASFSPSVEPLESAVVPVPGTGPLGDRIAIDIPAAPTAAWLDRLVAAGVSWGRVRAEWASIERAAGVRDFSALRTTVDALRSRGLKVVFALDGSPPGHVSASSESPRTDVERQAFAAFAESVAREFADGVNAYELWNRPDATWRPSSNAAEFVALVAAAAPRIRVGDPDATVVAGAIRHKPFFREIIEAGIAPHVDALAFQRDRSPEFVVSDWLELRRWQQGAPVQPLLNLGNGYSATWYGAGDSAAARRAQAVELLREVLLGWTLGQPLINAGDLVDLGANPSDARANMGLLTAAGEEKPVLLALQTLAAHAQDRALVGVFSLTPTTLYGLKLEGNDRTVLILWSAAPVAAFDVALPTPESAVDLLGVPVPTTLEDGRTGVRLDEQTGPVFLVYPRTPAPLNPDGELDVEPLLGWRCGAAPRSLLVPLAVLVTGWTMSRRRRRPMERSGCWVNPASASGGHQNPE